MLRRFVPAALLAAALAQPLTAQDNLRNLVSQLFVFGECGQPLCLDVDAQFHGSHYLPSVAEGNLALISFVQDAIAEGASNAPISATSSGATFKFVGGLPVATSTSAGPIFAERSQTLGRGQFFVGANITGIHFTTLSGIPTDNLVINFTHQDVNPVGVYGDPLFENDIIRLRMALDVNLLISSIFFTVGVTDFIDIGFDVPFIRTSISGSSEAEILPFGPTAVHFFGGTSADPILRATNAVSGSATGIGDIAGRIKVNVGQSSTFGAAILADARFQTGNEEELLGSGATTVRALGIVSAQFGDFSPHLNGGYLVRTSDTQNDAILATVGFDQLMTPWATFAMDLVSEWELGDPRIVLPGTITYDTPFPRTVQATSFVQRRNNVLNASAGMKFAVRGGTVIVANAIVPLNKTGLQPDILWTTGLEFSF